MLKVSLIDQLRNIRGTSLNKNQTLKRISRYFPNLELLSFRGVFAFPNDSRIGADSNICSVTILDTDLLTAERYCVSNLVVSVFPAPDSPLIKNT